MNPPPSRLPAEQLLEHGAFLRRLAGRLVRTEDEADDVVQDTYRIALERQGPPPRRLRAWLAGIVRHRARRTARDVVRRGRRHERAARPEALPATVEVAARLEVQRRLAEAVAALEEPGRTAIVLRYLDGHMPAVIAARLGVPVRTVESRLRRAREALRQRLDAESGGRAPWQAALLPWVGAGAGWRETAASAAAASGTSGGALGAPLLTIGGTIMATKAWVAIGCIAGGLAGGWALHEVTAPAPVVDTRNDNAAAPVPEAAPVGLGRDVPELERAVTRAEQAEARVAQLEGRVRTLEAEARAREAAAAPTGPTTPGLAADPATNLKIPIGVGKLGDAMAKVDWEKAGTAASEMAPMLDEVIRGMADGTLDQARAMELGRRNLQLVNAAIALSDSGLSGTGVNGVFTHPASTANLIAATLAAAGLPLDEAQTKELTELADDFIQREAARVAAYGPDTLAFVRLVEESRLKQQFYDDVNRMLTPQQRTVLHPTPPPASMGSDLFSVGLIWQGQVVPVTAVTSEHGEATVLKILQQQLGIDDETLARLQPAVARWRSSLPQAVHDMPVLPADHMGLVSVERLNACLDPMRGLYHDALGILPPDSPAAKKLREGTSVLVPIGPRP